MTQRNSILKTQKDRCICELTDYGSLHRNYTNPIRDIPTEITTQIQFIVYS